MDLLLSSLSSSEDDDIELFIINRIRRLKRRKFKIQNISDIVRNYTEKDAAKTAEEHILAFVWYVANKSTLRSTAERFDVAVSTLFVMNNRDMEFLMNTAPLIMNFPLSEVENDNNVADFIHVCNTRILGIVGCIDDTYMNCRTPAKMIRSTYVNHHDTPSLTLQGICDSRKTFIDCFAGPLSKCHDAKIIDLSFVWLLVHHLGAEYHLLGDKAYGISENFLTPYKTYGQLTQQRTISNNKLSKASITVENSFDLLKNRFQHLIRTDLKTVDKTANFIIFCCILHTLCTDDDKLFLNDYMIEEIRNFYDDCYGNNNLMNDYNERYDRILGANKGNITVSTF